MFLGGFCPPVLEQLKIRLFSSLRSSCAIADISEDLASHLGGISWFGLWIIQQYAETKDHGIYPRGARIFKHGTANYGKRLSLESWHSTMNSDALNKMKAFLGAYHSMGLLKNQGRYQQHTRL